MIELGSKAKDIISGYEGIVSGRAEYLTGCVQYVLSSTRLKDDGTIPPGEWIDEMRLTVTAKPKKALVAARERHARTAPGGPPRGPRRK